MPNFFPKYPVEILLCTVACFLQDAQNVNSKIVKEIRHEETHRQRTEIYPPNFLKNILGC
jgi:hypothetical protein